MQVILGGGIDSFDCLRKLVTVVNNTRGARAYLDQRLFVFSAFDIHQIGENVNLQVFAIIMAADYTFFAVVHERETAL